MKTEEELNADILKITLKIAEVYPELSKYIGEMPVKVPEPVGNEITIKNLTDYYASLEELLKNYTKNHEAETK